MAGSVIDKLERDVALAPMTTLGVGGNARFFLDATSEQAIEDALAWAEERAISVTIFGGGSNVLASDHGIDGLVVRVRVRGMKEQSGADAKTVVLEVGAGEELDRLVVHCIEEGYAGLECLSGIPGLVGATPVQNVGAYGQEIGDVILAVRTMNRETRKIETFDTKSCHFSYRHSVFKGELRDRHVILSVTLGLTRDGLPRILYPEVARELSIRGGDPTSIADVRAVVLAVRRAKSMVIDSADPNHRSAGSFFVNPVVAREEADAIEARVHAHVGDPTAMPRYPIAAAVKLSAAWLIERAGFAKGMADGAVGISTRHALALVNRGGATATEVWAFAHRIRTTVFDLFGAKLVAEPVLLGFSDEDAAALR